MLELLCILWRQNKTKKKKKQHQIPQTLRLGMVLSMFAVFELQKLGKVIKEKGDIPCLKSIIPKQYLIVSLVSGLKLLLTDQLRRSPVVRMSLLLFNWLVRKLLLNQPLPECESKVLQSFLYTWAQVIFKWVFALCVWTVRWSSQWRGRYRVCSSNCSLLQLEGRTLCIWVLETGKWVLTSQVIPQLQAVKRGTGKEMNLAADLWGSRANKHLFCILLASFVPLTSSLPVPHILLWHPFIQSYFMCFRLISRVEVHFTESTNCSSPKANTSWPA